ncbi:glyoxalase [Psychroflexus maritimus]|uniref:Glyoxalase n=1 Tax=Psychroflexus maritimus TaxID=2714865 RepID=A0A967ACC3_9FLAO|nr:glyoxalase [Psychroflexus maritimus]NGZ89667.1 glyoxalase [Psychroflexus maritimus]
MEERDYLLKKIRPELKNAKVYKDTLQEERFQNECLRPIAKFQNDIILHIYSVYIDYRKNVYHELNLDKKSTYIEESIKKDSKIRRQLQGVFIGHFTLQEYKTYTSNYKAFNKRINNLCIERIKSQMQFFEIHIQN